MIPTKQMFTQILYFYQMLIIIFKQILQQSILVRK